MEMTPAQQRMAKARAAKRPVNQQPTAPSPARRAPRPTPTDRFLDEHENQIETVQQRSVGSDGEGQRFTHTSAKLVVLYFPALWGWESREVPSTNIRLCLGAGARYDCGDCQGDCSPDPRNPEYNNCPGRDKFATRQCPECGRLVYDFGARSVNVELLSDVNAARASDAAGTMIEDGAYTLATPTARTKATLDEHIAGYHPTMARTLGLREPQRFPEREAVGA